MSDGNIINLFGGKQVANDDKQPQNIDEIIKRTSVRTWLNCIVPLMLEGHVKIDDETAHHMAVIHSAINALIAKNNGLGHPFQEVAAEYDLTENDMKIKNDMLEHLKEDDDIS